MSDIQHEEAFDSKSVLSHRLCGNLLQDHQEGNIALNKSYHESYKITNVYEIVFLFFSSDI